MSPVRRRRIYLMYGNGGGGHKASAQAVQAVLQSSLSTSDVDIQLVDAAAISGAAAGDWLYNVLLSYNAVSAIEVMHSAIQYFWFIARPGLMKTFRKFWGKTNELVVVVSFVPMLNAVFAETLPPHVSLFTVLTDFTHTKSHPWIQHPRQHLITGTDVAYSQALQMAYLPPSFINASCCVSKTSGMVVHPKFYTALEPPMRERKFREMKLNPRIPTVLILFGGSPPTDTVTRLVDLLLQRSTDNSVNIIAVCAKNRQLYDKLKRRQARNPTKPLFITGFSSEIPLLMHLSSVLIGKPGPGVVSEAFVSGLPSVLITGNDGSNVMKQERDVLDWVRCADIARIAHNPQEAASISGKEIDEMRRRIAALPPNRAVFEVRDLIVSALHAPRDPFQHHASGCDDASEEELSIPQIDLSHLDTHEVCPSTSDAWNLEDAKTECSSEKPADRVEGTARLASLSPVTIRAAPDSMVGTPSSISSSRATYAC